MLIVTLGDSVTKGVRPGVEPEEIYSFLWQVDLRARGLDVEVLSVGIGGENTDMSLARLDTVLDLKPRLVTVMYGINDAAVNPGEQEPRVPLENYTENLRSIVSRIRLAGIRPLLLTPNPMSPFGVTQELYASRRPYDTIGINGLLQHYAAAVRTVAAEEEVPLTDIWSEFESRAHCVEDYRRLMTDGMHPNPAGHRLIADALGRISVPWLRSYLEEFPNV